MDDQTVKILFRFHSNILDEDTVETLWAIVLDQQKGLYKIDNIPFYAVIACDDIVFAEYDEDEQMITYRETIEHSGNSTIHVVLMNKDSNAMEIRNSLAKSGCESEGLNDRYFALEIPVKLNYKIIKETLINLRSEGIIDISETCLSDKHWEEVYSPG